MSGFGLFLQPLFGILLGGAIPDLEMDGGDVAVFLQVADGFAGTDLLAGFDTHAGQLAIEGIILAVLDEHTLVVAGNHHNLLDHAVEDAVNLRAGIGGDGDAVVLRQADILVDRMIVHTEPVGDDALVDRPAELAAILCEFA